ncbi:MAG: helix-turn-helix domain-containing protein [Oscillospiraceae bacterium]|nr:helix-turn-helix domain-containing protein [Oscillospiraceae bacterium]
MELKDILRIKRTELNLTLEEIGNAVGVSKATVQRWESGEIKNLRRDKIGNLAKVLNISPSQLLGDLDEDNTKHTEMNIPGIIPLPTGKRVPIIGSIACGTPILAQENIEGYLSLNPDDSADFCLICKGDSMLPRCQNGDLVLIRKQPTVDNGEIAAVRIGDEATLKKVYRPAPDQLMLIAENSDFPPIVLTKDEINSVSIEGKAIGFIRMF